MYYLAYYLTYFQMKALSWNHQNAYIQKPTVKEVTVLVYEVLCKIIYNLKWEIVVIAFYRF